MDILIPYVHSDANELKFALRSIEKYQQGSEVIVIGCKPSWYRGILIPHTRNSLTKQLNVRDKILAAIPHLTNDFTLWYDDLFQVSPGPIIPTHCGTLLEASKKNLGTWFMANVVNTMKIYPDGLYYGNHYPIVINGDKFIEAMKVDWKKDYLVKSLYGNYANINGEYLPDCKFRHGDIAEFSQGRQFLSTDVIHNVITNYLKELFPEKSRYET